MKTQLEKVNETKLRLFLFAHSGWLAGSQPRAAGFNPLGDCCGVSANGTEGTEGTQGGEAFVAPKGEVLAAMARALDGWFAERGFRAVVLADGHRDGGASGVERGWTLKVGDGRLASRLLRRGWRSQSLRCPRR